MCGINAYRVPRLDYSVRKEELWRLREGVHELALTAENKPKPWPLRPLTDRSIHCSLRAFCFLFRKKGTLLPYPFFLLCFQCPWLYFFWDRWSPLYTYTLFKLHPPPKTLHSYFRKRVNVKFCSLLTFPISCHDVGDR